MNTNIRFAAVAVVLIAMTAPAFAQHTDNATIQGTESAPGNQGAPCAAERLGNLVTTPFGPAPLPRADTDPRGGPLPDNAVNTSQTSVFKTPGGPNSSDAR